MRYGSLLFVTVVAMGLTASPASAWDSTGHEQIADIAFSQLNAKAKSAIAVILSAGDPKFSPKGTTDGELRTAFRNAATFPDVLKDDRHTSFEVEVQTFNDTFHPKGDPLVSGGEQALCKSWHFYDEPIRFTGKRPLVAASNALAALSLAQDELSRLQLSIHPDRRMESWWLVWIEHLVGDLHQPLHCTSSFASGQSDGGGNAFKLGLDQPNAKHPGDKMSLHTFWDAGIDHAKSTEKAKQLPIRVDQVTVRWNGEGLLKLTSPEATNLNVQSWIDDGAKSADKTAYTGIAVGDIPDDSYKSKQETLCKRQAVLAGYRLANLLNGLLGK